MAAAPFQVNSTPRLAPPPRLFTGHGRREDSGRECVAADEIDVAAEVTEPSPRRFYTTPALPASTVRFAARYSNSARRHSPHFHRPETRSNVATNMKLARKHALKRWHALLHRIGVRNHVNDVLGAAEWSRFVAQGRLPARVRSTRSRAALRGTSGRRPVPSWVPCGLYIFPDVVPAQSRQAPSGPPFRR